MNATGRPLRVYSNSFRPKADQLFHEVRTTDFLLCYPGADMVRGWDVNGEIRPDAEMTLDGIRFYVELDTGSESHRVVRRRQLQYRHVSDLVLYVTLSAKRMENLRKRCQSAIRTLALFTTLDQVRTDPRGPIWLDADGNRTSI